MNAIRDRLLYYRIRIGRGWEKAMNESRGQIIKAWSQINNSEPKIGGARLQNTVNATWVMVLYERVFDWASIEQRHRHNMVYVQHKHFIIITIIFIIIDTAQVRCAREAVYWRVLSGIMCNAHLFSEKGYIVVR